MTERLEPAFRVGPVEIANPLVLAPMEDVSNLPFRVLAKRIAGPGLMFTEFVSAMAVHHGAQKTFKKLRIHPEERPLGIQIFGADEDTMVETAVLCEEAGADILDINMGCWVPKVCKTGAGAALLKNPELAAKIVKAICDRLTIPVTVKVRAGWDYSHFAAPDFGKRCEDAGAKMLTLHARFARQGFEGEADWSLIAKLREAISIPLVGNGDVKTPEHAREMLDRTGCDGVMVGRAAISNPWALRAIRQGIMGEEVSPEPGLNERIETALEHVRMMIAYEANTPTFEEAKHHPDFSGIELRAVRHLRGQIPLYIKGFPGAGQIRRQLSLADRLEELETILGDFQRGQPEIALSRTST